VTPGDAVNSSNSVRQAIAPEAVVAVIVVNFRTPELTIDCLRSLEREVGDLRGIRVFVVENGSGDDSGQRIEEHIARSGWAEWCKLLISANNRGFAGGTNFGIEAAIRSGGARYFLLLNSDTLVASGCLARCIRTMDSNQRIGALSCRVLNADGSTQNVCRRFPTPLRCFVSALLLPWRLPSWFSWADCEDLGWDRNSCARDVEWIGGAFMMLRATWIAQHGALDDRFFFYGEDVEICHRVWQTGFRCHYDPAGTITHLGGGSSDPSRMAADALGFHQWRGRYLIQQICYGKLSRLLAQVVDLLTVVRRITWGYVTGQSASSHYTAAKDTFQFLIRNWNEWGRRAGG